MAARPAIPDEQAALLAAVVAQPDDDTPRLVYADWLQEHGDETQAGFIRDSVTLARMSPRAKGRKALAASVRDAADDHGEEWLGALGVTGLVGFQRYDRGFPARVTFGGADEFFAAADALFRFVPVRGLAIEGGSIELSDDAVLRRLAKMPQLARLTDLRLYELQEGKPAAWRALFRSPHLANLTFLGLAGCGIYETETGYLAAAPPLAGLTDLDLSYNGIGVGGLRAILDSPHLARLKNLWLDHNFFGDEEGEDEALAELEEQLGDGLHTHESPEDDEDETD